MGCKDLIQGGKTGKWKPEITPRHSSHLPRLLSALSEGLWRAAQDLQSTRPSPVSLLQNLLAMYFHSPCFAAVHTCFFCPVACFLQKKIQQNS